jgi:uncharacterized membrane protein
MDYLQLAQAVLAAMVTGGGYSVMFAISKINKGEVFEKAKMIKTVIIGCAVGLVAYLAGYELTKENFEVYLAGNGFVIVVVDNLWSIGRNYYLSKKA